MGVRPFKLLNESELASLKSLIDKAASQWAQDWLTEAFCEITVSLAEASSRGAAVQSRATAWRQIMLTDEHWVGLFVSAVSAQGLDAAFSSGAAAELNDGLLMQDLRDKVLAALAEQVGHELGIASAERRIDYSAPVAEVWRAGAGAVVADVRLGDASPGLTLGLMLSPALVSRALAGRIKRHAPAPDLARIREALSAQQAELEAWVGSAELGLAMVQSIAVGDVIKLDARVDQPLRVCLKDHAEQELCGGFLGTYKGYKALQLTIK